MNADGSNLRSITGHDNSLGGAWPTGLVSGRKADRLRHLLRRQDVPSINTDGTGLKYLGAGCMPTFGAGGNRLAFSWSGTAHGTHGLTGE